MTHLVVLGGPIAAGKSTVAAALAARVVEAGLVAVVADLDDVARMAQAPSARSAAVWAESHRPFAALVAGWLRSAVDVVIAHGSLYTPDHIAELTADAPAGTRISLVLLRVSYDAALTRVTGDPERGLSRDPGFLRDAHDRFAALLNSPSESAFSVSPEDPRRPLPATSEIQGEDSESPEKGPGVPEKRWTFDFEFDTEVTALEMIVDVLASDLEIEPRTH